MTLRQGLASEIKIALRLKEESTKSGKLSYFSSSTLKGESR
jgi:hypothetical protein